MRRSHHSLIAAAGCSIMSLPGWADLTEAWERRYNNPQADFADYGEAIAVDSTGAVYVAGFTFFDVENGSLFVPRFLTIKYQPNGTQSWVRDFTTAETWAAAAWTVSIDPSNDDVVVSGGVNGHEDWGIVKYDSAGQQQWAVTYEADSYYLTEPDDVFISSEGEIFVTGDIGTFSGPDPQAPVLVYGSAGQLVFDERYVGPWGLSASGRAIAPDAEGNIYVTGSTDMPGLSGEAFLVKYNAAGQIVWDRTFGGASQTSFDTGEDLIVDENGDVVVLANVGYNTSAGVNIVLRKYDSDGNLLWSTTHGTDGGLDEVARTLARDSAGQFVVAGYAEVSQGQRDILAVMFDAQGQVDWSATHGGAGGGPDAAYDLAVGDDGAILLAGVIQPFANVDFAFAAQLNPEDGGLIDIAEYGGPMDGDAWAAAIALGPQDEVYITGSSPDFTTDFDLFTLRYDRAEDLIGASLVDMNVAFGQLIAGTVAELQNSDNFYVRTRSRFGFTANERNLIDLRVGGTTGVGSPQSIHLTIEGRLNSAGGTMRVRLKDWSTNSFQQVHQYPMGTSETMEVIADLSAANRVRAPDGRIELSMRASMMATFSALGFDFFTDHVGIAVGE